MLARRFVVFSLAGVSTVAAALQLHALFKVKGITNLELAMLALFTLSFAWVVLSFWSSVFGFFQLMTTPRLPGLVRADRAVPRAPLVGRTAVVMPVYNEDPLAVTIKLQAIYESVRNSGTLESFDFFMLSDSTQPDAWVAEELAWAALCDRVNGHGRIFYRKRRDNVGKKSGNIESFLKQFGKSYAYMLVLDADSIMSGEALSDLVRLMDANPGAGIIQASPAVVNRNTWFARVQQFASRVYGPVNSAGLSWWLCSDSNYWGHNAIIRTQPFMEHCGLPVLSGEPPFGGHILSHDFVEAALMRRAGFTVWLIPEMGGSYEEMPPNIIDYAKRDQRWCQGNLQHLRLVFASRMRAMSRMHFIMGIMSYVASPLWLSFLAAGVLVAQQDKTIEPVYFPAHQRTLFPDWPIFDASTAIALFFVSLAMLFIPKLFGLIVILKDKDTRRQVGGVFPAFMSFVVESIYSVLLAPTMMLFQTFFVLSTLLGVSVSWGTQNRGEDSTGWWEAIRTHGWFTLVGAGLAYVTYIIAPVLIGWVVPVLAGLALTVPISVFTSRTSWGLFAKRMKLFLIPEETEPPWVVARVTELTEQLTLPTHPTAGLERVITDPLAHALHLSVVTQHELDGVAPPPLATDARRKAVEQGVATLTPKEKMALLWDPTALADLFGGVDKAASDVAT